MTLARSPNCRQYLLSFSGLINALSFCNSSSWDLNDVTLVVEDTSSILKSVVFMILLMFFVIVCAAPVYFNVDVNMSCWMSWRTTYLGQFWPKCASIPVRANSWNLQGWFSTTRGIFEPKALARHDQFLFWWPRETENGLNKFTPIMPTKKRKKMWKLDALVFIE